MTGAPETVPAMLPDGIAVERATVADAAAIQALDGLAPSTRRLLDRDLAADDRWYLVARGATDRAVVGAGVILVAADEAHLLDLAVARAQRRRGIGAALVTALRDLARDHLGATAMTLEVRQGNAAARGLYRRLGFREEGRRPGYYPDAGPDGGRETAVILWDRELDGGDRDHPDGRGG